MARIEGVQGRILSCAGRWSVEDYVAWPMRENAYRPTATTSCQGVGDATPARGGGGPFLGWVRGPFRLCVCRSRDFHRSSLTRRAEKDERAGVRCSAGDVWGDQRARPCPRGLSRRRGLVLCPQSVRKAEMEMAMWARVQYTIAAPRSRNGQVVPPECRPASVSLDQKEETMRVVRWATKNACTLPSVPNQAAHKGRRSMTRPRRWCGAG
jgi:hypothetical protein